MAQVPPFLGSLASFENYDSTRHIGTVFPDKSVQLSDFLSAPNADQLIKDLAVLVSHRGVVFLKAQDLTLDQQRELVTRLGELTGKPESSKLHRHPVTPDNAPLGTDIMVINSEQSAAYPKDDRNLSAEWHTDVTFEPVPSDYAILQLKTVPPTGGDTLWASGYEAYDKLSAPYKTFLEGLTAVHTAPEFYKTLALAGCSMPEAARGAPLNVGLKLTATHPVVRTNPVTGYKALFVNKIFTKRIVELSIDESDDVLKFLTQLVSQNHDLQVRYKWDAGDVAIWDNRCTFHAATPDYEALREGVRVMSLGEVPYLDPKSKSRREALGLKNSK